MMSAAEAKHAIRERLQARLDRRQNEHHLLHADAAGSAADSAVRYILLLQIRGAMEEMHRIQRVLKSSITIHRAVCDGDIKTVRLLLDVGGVDVNAQHGNSTRSYFTPLHCASFAGQTQIAQLLLDRGGDVHAKNTVQETPLHTAAIQGHTQVAQLLLDRAADVNTRNQDGWTPLLGAINCDTVSNDTVTLLLDNGADIHARDEVRTNRSLSLMWLR
eukprot:GDKI01012953.1.p1 GENE.GDKI01012953.1~~GDKI01012953.1.p1  ORF type:complete len:217 (-),score=55.43 GDKI01012953.1:35-685(-)